MTSGLRERKKQATRAALHEAALRLVAERGLDGVSVDDIAARADVSARTFFNYFPSKDDAVVGLDPAMADRQARAYLDRPSSESPVQALRAVAREQAVLMAADAELWPLRLRVIDAHAPLLARLAAAFAEAERALAGAVAHRSGTAATVDIYPTLLAAVSGAAMRTALHQWHATDFTASLPQLLDQTWDVLEAGLQAPRSSP